MPREWYPSLEASHSALTSPRSPKTYLLYGRAIVNFLSTSRARDLGVAAEKISWQNESGKQISGTKISRTDPKGVERVLVDTGNRGFVFTVIENRKRAESKVRSYAFGDQSNLPGGVALIVDGGVKPSDRRQEVISGTVKRIFSEPDATQEQNEDIGRQLQTEINAMLEGVIEIQNGEA